MPSLLNSSVSFGRVGGLAPEKVIFGQSEAMRAIRNTVEKVAGTNVPVLIRGESGTGKEVLAKLIHCRSPWQSGPFVKINCPSIPGTLLESELFGYEKGAFTGAYDAKPGWVELAQGGTLFLDEIAELDMALQAKLLHLLQDGTFSRLGGQEDKQVEVRIVCATSRLLEHEIETGTFRQDLFYRINVVTIELPSLRERHDDIPNLVEYFLEVFNKAFKREVRPPSASLLQLLLQHHWPGNIRELENLTKRYVILDSEEVIINELLGADHNRFNNAIRADGSISLKKLTRQAVRDLERKIILDVLQANNWNRKEAARILKISYRALFYKIKEAGVPQKRALAAAQQGSTVPSKPRSLDE